MAGFDRVVALQPEVAPQLWQRGIALYYAGRFDAGRLQFESHRTVNPADVENAAWHFLCVAKAESAAAAKDRMLPVGTCTMSLACTSGPGKTEAVSEPQ